MSIKGTIPVEIIYCVPWSYHGEAVWMTAEFFAEGGSRLAITVTPGDKGVLKVYVDGEKIYDKSEEDDKHPDLYRVKEMRSFIKNKIAIMG